MGQLKLYMIETGKAGLTTSRIQEILNHLPNNAPVYEIRPNEHRLEVKNIMDKKLYRE